MDCSIFRTLDTMTSHEQYVGFVMYFVMTSGLCTITLGGNSRILMIKNTTQTSMNWSTWFSFQSGFIYPILENTLTSNLSKKKILNANIALRCRSFEILLIESLEIDSLGATRQAAQREEHAGTRFPSDEPCTLFPALAGGGDKRWIV